MLIEQTQQLFRMLHERWKCEAVPAPIAPKMPLKNQDDSEFYNNSEAPQFYNNAASAYHTLHYN